MKKGLLIAIGFFLVGFQNYAQSPLRINYQAALRNSGEEIAANTDESLRFTLHAKSFYGLAIYQEKNVAATSEFGLVNLVVGRGKCWSGCF